MANNLRTCPPGWFRYAKNLEIVHPEATINNSKSLNNRTVSFLKHRFLFCCEIIVVQLVVIQILLCKESVSAAYNSCTTGRGEDCCARTRATAREAPLKRVFGAVLTSGRPSEPPGRSENGPGRPKKPPGRSENGPGRPKKLPGRQMIRRPTSIQRMWRLQRMEAAEEGEKTSAPGGTGGAQSRAALSGMGTRNHFRG